MAEQGADQCQRNHRHDDQRRTPGGEHPHQHGVHQQQADDQAVAHVGQGFLLVDRAPLKAVAHVVAAGQRRQLLRGGLEHHAGGGLAAVDVGGDVGSQLRIGMAQGGEALIAGKGDHLTQRHETAIVKANVQVTQAGQAFALGARQLHAYFDLVALVLVDLRQPAVVGRAQLVADALDAEPQRLPVGRQAVNQLLAAPGHIVVGADHALDTGEDHRQRVGGLLELLRVGSGQADVDILAGRAALLLGDVDAVDAGRCLNTLLPLADKGLVAHLAVVRRYQLDHHRAQVVALARNAVVAQHLTLAGYRGEDKLATQRRFGLAQTVLQLPHEGHHAGARRAGNKVDVGVQHLRLGRREETEADAPAAEQADGDDYADQGAGQRCAAVGQRGLRQAAKAAIAKAVEARVEARADAVQAVTDGGQPAGALLAWAKGLAQVVWQHHKALQQ